MEEFGQFVNEFKEDICRSIDSIRDPEKSATLAQLDVVDSERVHIQFYDDNDQICSINNYSEEFVNNIERQRNEISESVLSIIWRNNIRWIIDVVIKPTIPHCHLASIIGLSIYCRLKELINEKGRINITFLPGSYNDIERTEKQLADKERRLVAFEDKEITRQIEKCLSS
ncbi:hypothetical protein SNEBB_006777 [Seison nebaliae]|nr:hypothetical protein SNEBB_006777 [Seison nebaliae]